MQDVLGERDSVAIKNFVRKNLKLNFAVQVLENLKKIHEQEFNLQSKAKNFAGNLNYRI